MNDDPQTRLFYLMGSNRPQFPGSVVERTNLIIESTTPKVI